MEDQLLLPRAASASDHFNVTRLNGGGRQAPSYSEPGDVAIPSLRARQARSRKPGGPISAVGKVDSNGSGVPFKLCTRNVKTTARELDTVVASNNDTAGPAHLRASLSLFFTMKPATKNV